MLQDRVAECQREGLIRDGDLRALAASVWASIHGLCSLIITGNLGSSEGERHTLIQLHLDHIAAGLARFYCSKLTPLTIGRADVEEQT